MRKVVSSFRVGARMWIKHTSLSGSLCILFAMLLIIAGAGCSSVPVQEMSDARQAIQAARDEGVSINSSSEFLDAMRLIELAEQELEKGEYGQARMNALKAKKKAIDARQQVILKE